MKEIVFYEEKNYCFFGTLIEIVKSEVDPKFDLAYIENNGVCKVALLSQIKYANNSKNKQNE